MYKHAATVGGVALSVLFVVVFFAGRAETKHLTEVAPRVGMNADDLLAMAPRVASQTGATLGTSRRVVYLLAERIEDALERADQGMYEAKRTGKNRTCPV